MTYAYAIIILLILLSGFADSQGFIHASKVWVNGMPVWKEFVKSSLGFGLGIVTFWLAIRYMDKVGIVSPEIQTILWFAAAIIGVAVLGGHFLHWKAVDQLVALGVISGIGWLLLRTNT